EGRVWAAAALGGRCRCCRGCESRAYGPRCLVSRRLGSERLMPADDHVRRNSLVGRGGKACNGTRPRRRSLWLRGPATATLTDSRALSLLFAGAGVQDGASGLRADRLRECPSISIDIARLIRSSPNAPPILPTAVEASRTRWPSYPRIVRE